MHRIFSLVLVALVIGSSATVMPKQQKSKSAKHQNDRVGIFDEKEKLEKLVERAAKIVTSIKNEQASLAALDKLLAIEKTKEPRNNNLPDWH